MLILGIIVPWSNTGGGVVQFGKDVKAQASLIAPWNQWRMVMVDVDNKVPMYLQNDGAPFYYVPESKDFPREGTTAQFMAWLEKDSGQQWNPQRTIIVAHYKRGDTLPLNYLSVDHQAVVTQPDNGERLLHPRSDASVAFIPNAPAQ